MGFDLTSFSSSTARVLRRSASARSLSLFILEIKFREGVDDVLSCDLVSCIEFLILDKVKNLSLIGMESLQ